MSRVHDHPIKKDGTEGTEEEGPTAPGKAPACDGARLVALAHPSEGIASA